MDDARDCRSCRLFVDNADELERALPGLTILSSASGSSRGGAGICRARDTFQDPEPACSEFRLGPRLTIREEDRQPR